MRGPVEGAPDLIFSEYRPQEQEQCTEVGTGMCAYWSNPFKSVPAMCAESKAEEARAAGANYIRVDQPNVSVGGFKTSAPVAYFYSCTNLNS